MAPRIIVAGGGAVGLGVAWRAAELGCTVTLVDPAPGSGASAVAAGMLAPVTEVHYGEEPLLKLNLAAASFYPEWVARVEKASGMDAGYRRCGTLLVARDLDDSAALDDYFAFQERLGLEVSKLKAREVRKLEPSLSPTIRGGILVEGDHQADPAALVAALAAAYSSSGVETVRKRVAGLVVHDGRATGMRMEDGETLSADTVVVAAGSWSAQIADFLPVRPVKGQILQLRSVGPPPIAHNVRGLDVYLVPRSDGRIVVGATMEEQGWDSTVTAEAVHDLLRYAYELLPGIMEMEFLNARVGFRPGTPDNAPLLGPTGVEGVVAATGHFRNGILLAPLTSEAIAVLVAGGDLDPVIEPFSPTRFERSEAPA
jgi:glycine oxidase